MCLSVSPSCRVYSPCQWAAWPSEPFPQSVLVVSVLVPATQGRNGRSAPVPWPARAPSLGCNWEKSPMSRVGSVGVSQKNAWGVTHPPLRLVDHPSPYAWGDPPRVVDPPPPRKNFDPSFLEATRSLRTMGAATRGSLPPANHKGPKKGTKSSKGHGGIALNPKISRMDAKLAEEVGGRVTPLPTLAGKGL